MPKQITLNGIQRSGINVYKENNVVRVEANYQILSGVEVIKSVSKDITSALSSEQRAIISNAYDAIFSRIEGLELS